MELTPLVPADRQVIERYGRSGFRVTGVVYRGAVLVFPDRTLPWEAAGAAEVTWESLTGWSNGTWSDGSWDSGSWDNGSWDNGSWDSGSWDAAQALD